MKRYFLATIFFLLVHNQSSANENYELALRAYQQKDIDAAYIYLKNSLNQDQRHLPSKVLLGEVLLRQNYVHEAITEFESALTFDADLNVFASSLIRAYVITRNLERLYDMEEKRLDENNLLELLLAKANGYASQGLNQKTEELYLRILDQNIQTFRVLSSLINFYISSKQIDKAKFHLETMEDTYSTHAIYHFLKGKVAAYEDNTKMAIQHFDNALSKQSDDPTFKRALASQLMKDGNHKRAKDLINNILKQTPNDPFALLYLGRLQLVNSENELAISVFDRINEKLSIIPDELLSKNNSLQLIIGVNRYLSGNFESAQQALESFISKSPKNIEALSILSDIYIKTNQNRRALNLLDRQYDIVSQNIRLGSLLCELYLEAKKGFKCNQLLGLLKYEFKGHQNLAIIETKLLQSQGKVKDALNIIRQTTDLFNSSIDIQLLYISLLRQNKANDDALSFVDRLMLTNPENTGLKAIKADILIAQKRYPEAQTLNSQLFNNDSASFSAQLNQAELEIAREALNEAKHILNGLNKRYPKEYQPKVLLAQVLHEQSAIEEAKAILLELMVDHPKQSLPLSLLSKIYLFQGRLDDALSLVNKLNREYFLTPEFITLKAQVHYQRAERAEVNKQLRILYSLAKDDSPRLLALASLQKDLEDYVGAKESIERAIEIDNTDFAKRELLKLALYTGDSARANTLLDDLTGRHSMNSSILTLKGEAIIKFEQDYQSAASWFLKALAIDFSYLRAGINMYKLAINDSTQFGQKFEQSMESSLAKNPQLYLYRNLLADYFLLTLNYEAANKHYSELLLADAPNRPDILNNMANIKIKSKQYEAAQAFILEANELAPGQPHILNTYGDLMFSQMNFEQALSLYRQAYTKDSQDPFINYNLARTLKALAREAEADAIIDRIRMDKIPEALAKKIKQL